MYRWRLPALSADTLGNSITRPDRVRRVHVRCAGSTVVRTRRYGWLAPAESTNALRSGAEGRGARWGSVWVHSQGQCLWGVEVGRPAEAHPTPPAPRAKRSSMKTLSSTTRPCSSCGGNIRGRPDARSTTLGPGASLLLRRLSLGRGSRHDAQGAASQPGLQRSCDV